MVLVISAIIYFVMPTDLIPDILPGGFIADVTVIGFVIKQIKADLDNFLAWEVEQVDIIVSLDYKIELIKFEPMKPKIIRHWTGL